MLCEKCGKNEATYYYHENVNGRTKTLRLCGDCAEKMEQADELPKLRMDRFFEDFDPFFDEPFLQNPMKALNGLLNGFFGDAAPAAGDAPYCAENANGFKLVRGSGIKMEVLELENPADNGKVQYQELIGADVDSAMNAGFMTVDHCTFNWDVEPQEIYYVVEGNMTVTVDGVPHTAYPGDCLFIQKGSKVTFSSGNTRCKVFYCTY